MKITGRQHIGALLHALLRFPVCLHRIRNGVWAQISSKLFYHPSTISSHDAKLLSVQHSTNQDHEWMDIVLEVIEPEFLRDM